MTDIEKLAIEAGFGEALLTWPNVPEKLLALCEAYAAKVLEKQSAEIAQLKTLIKDDAFAISFQSMAQYRKSLLEAIK